MHSLPTPSLIGSQASPSPGMGTLAGSDGLHCSEGWEHCRERRGKDGEEREGGDRLPASGQDVVGADEEEGRTGNEEGESTADRVRLSAGCAVPSRWGSAGLRETEPGRHRAEWARLSLGSRGDRQGKWKSYREREDSKSERARESKA